MKPSTKRDNRLKLLNIWPDPIVKEGGLSKVREFFQCDRAYSIIAVNPQYLNTLISQSTPDPSNAWAQKWNSSLPGFRI